MYYKFAPDLQKIVTNRQRRKGSIILFMNYIYYGRVNIEGAIGANNKN